MQKLDLLQLPLQGNALIEASAGTGKTYTIAALYLRAVLGHGGQAPLLPPQILVVTFTEAATGELTERIRQRLSSGARFFRDAYAATEHDAETAASTLTSDPVLQQLAAAFPKAHWPHCAMQLELAAQWMDEAAISTIHGWCNRMLSEHAFDSGSRFEEELSTDQSELMTQVVQDYWRSYVYPLPIGGLLRWQRSFSEPLALQKALQAVWREQPLPVTADPTVLIDTEQQQRQQQLATLKAPWSAWVPELAVLIEQARSEKRLNGTKMRTDYVQKWLDGILRFATDPAADSLDIGAGSSRLTPEGIADACKGEPLQHPAFAAMAELVEALAQLSDCSEDLRQHALHWCQLRFADSQRQLGCFGFDDMLDRLHHALQGERGDVLAERIRSQFPLALIDEFQDTDPIQYGIFQQIYPLATPRSDCGLLLIGDPKQAIYAFRGADIYTYLQAKQATQPRHYSLDTNFRSTTAMVETVNLLFLKAEQRETGCGAFLFRQQQNLVAFEAVKAKGRAEQFVRLGAPMPALDLVYLDSSEKVLSKAAYFDAMATHCAAQISELLQEGAAMQTGFKAEQPDTSDQLIPLQPADIAVLVNNQQEASAIRQALARYGVRSVYLSDRGSVFDTAIAHDLLLWLEACADPQNEQKVRSALASQSLGWSYTQLARLQQDEWFFEHWLDRFNSFAHVWQQQGVLPLVRQLLLEFQLVQTFAARMDGERQLTDLLHLAELLQQVSRTLEGELALLRYFKEHLAGEQQLDADQLKLRLESDEALVRVVTIHKSKGLEYPLVFLPFIAAARALDPAKLPYRYHDDAQQLQLCYQKDESIFAKAEFERLGEDLRKLYVALTRSRHYCYLGLAAQKEQSAIGYILSDSGLLTPTEIAASLALLQHPVPHPALLIRPWQAPASPFSVVATMPAESSTHVGNASDRVTMNEVAPATAIVETPPLRSYAQMPQRARYQWWAASYSALAAGAGEAKTASHVVTTPTGDWGGADLAKNSELYQELKSEASQRADLSTGISTGIAASDADADSQRGATQPESPVEAVAEFTAESTANVVATPMQQQDVSQMYVRGAAAGTFLHDTLQWAAETGFAIVLQQPQLLQAYLVTHCQQQHWLYQDASKQGWQRRLLVTDAEEFKTFATAEQAVEPLWQWLLVLLQSRWLCDGVPTSLSSLALYKAELEFWFAASEVQTRAIDALLQQWLWPSQPRPALQPRTVNGMLKGFIDLTFAVDGRYHVLDYKSNYIDHGAYATESLSQIMLDKRYD
ncbi:MAG: exodeoxyribonuclease V subunit beta, partial [Gammaproteobacteria bacterium]|nr:exodeoxyribonuclease V subunit beta [Gammaproteobacteria bacterium]